MAEQPMTNHLAHDLRKVLADLNHPDHWPAALDRLESIIERVEAVDAEPVEVDASTELTASFGLEPDQEIRDRGLERAIDLLHGSDLSGMPERGVLWKLADQAAAYIRTGERPQ